MTRKLLLLMVAFAATVATYAQRTVSGKVVEKDSKEAVIQATVSLLKSDSSLVANAVTNASGAFSMTAPADGSYIVRITYVGFKTVLRNIRVADQKPVSLGTVSIEPDAIMLQGATVTKHVAKVTLKEDTFIYNAAAYRTPEGSVVEELVKRLPGAQVSDDGTITINGKTVKKVLIDGKEFMTGDTKTAIKNLPTSIVEKVKAYDEKSDLARISGIDDGEEQTVLDFGLKRGMNKGFFSNTDIGVGTKDRYSGRVMGALMKDDIRVMAMGNANNVGDNGFPGGGGGGRFGGGRQGLNASKMAGVNMNYEKKNKLKLDGSVRWNHNDGDAFNRQSSENFISDSERSFANSVSHNFSRSNQWNGQMRLEWMPDSMTNVNFRPTLSYNYNDGLNGSQSATFDDDPYDVAGVTDPLSQLDRLLGIAVNSRNNSSISYSDSKRLGGALQLNRKLNTMGRNVTLRLGANYSDGDSKSLSSNSVDLYQALTAIAGDSVSSYQTNRYNLTPQKSWDYSVRATYSEPIMRATFLQFSYQFQYRYTKSDRSTYDFSNPPYAYDFGGVTRAYRGWDDYLNRLGAPYTDFRDDDLSRFSEYKNYIHTAEVMLRIIRQTYNFNVGLQLIPQSSDFSYRYQGLDTLTHRTVVNFSPTADFRLKMGQQRQLRFNYRGNTSQPSMSDLLPVTDNSDPLNKSIGNKGLKPSFTQNFRLFYNNYTQERQQFLATFLNFSTTSNSITNKVTYDPTTGGRTSERVNVNGNWNANGNFTFNTAIDTAAFFNVNTTTGLGYSHSVGYVNLNRSTEAQRNFTNSLDLNERLAASYRNDWIEFEVTGAVNYMHSRNHLQSQSNLDTWRFSYGFNTNVTLPWGSSLSTDMNMNSRRGYNDASLNTNELIWNAQISHGFLQGKPLTVMLQFYDILHRQSNFTRSINAMSRTDSEYNSINSYAMLHVVYRLSFFGSKEAREQMQERQIRGPRPDFRGGDRPGGGGGNRRGGGFGGPRGGRF